MDPAAGWTNTTIENLIAALRVGPSTCSTPGARRSFLRCTMKAIHVRLDDCDLTDLSARAAVEFPSLPLATACRLIILHWIACSEQPRATASNRASTTPSSSDPLPDQEKKEERHGGILPVARELPAVALELPEGSRELPAVAQKKPRSRQRPLIEDEATAVARRVVERVNALRGTRYETEGHTFEEVARNIRTHLKTGILEADIMLVVENRHARWGADEKMAENCNPVTITRRANLPRYLAEAKAPQGTIFGGKRDASIRQSTATTEQEALDEINEWAKAHGISHR